VNVSNTNVTQRGEANEQHQNAVELIVLKNPTKFSTTHQLIPQTSTQPWAVSVHHDDNHELVQPFNEIVSTRCHGDLQPQVIIYP
jgi:hypothetical protein